MAAVPTLRITASALTLNLLFGSALLRSAHPNLNWHTADGITTVSSSTVHAAILGTVAASEAPPNCAIFCLFFFFPSTNF